MKVLFLNPEQYVRWEDEPSNHELRLPILNCGAVTEHRDVCYQRMFREIGRDATNRHILSLVEKFQPQVVVNSTTWPNQSVGSGLLHEIMRCGVPVFTHVWDTFVEPAPHELGWFYSCNYLGIASSISSYSRYKRLAEAGCGPLGVIFTTGHNVLTETVCKLDLPKTVDVALLGSNEGLRTVFKKFLGSRLAAEGISFKKQGGLIDWEKCRGPEDRERLTDEWLPWDKYVESINRAKVCICSQTGRGRDQVKGKIFEFLACGAFVLADASAETQRLIPAGCVAYYDDIPDCLEKAIYFVRNDAERDRIARTGQEWFHTHFDYRRFWSTFLHAAVLGDRPLPCAQFEEIEPKETGSSEEPNRQDHGPRICSTCLQELLSQGYGHFSSGNYLEAARQFGAACKLKPARVEAFAALSHLARLCKDIDTQQLAINAIRRLDPERKSPVGVRELELASKTNR